MATSANTHEIRHHEIKELKAKVGEFISSFSFRRFLRSNPWVLMPNGNFLGFFSFVPLMFREGPRAMLPTLYIFACIYILGFGAVYNYATKGMQFSNEYYEAFTVPWLFNFAGFLWTLYVYRDLFVAGLGLAALATFTVQSYSCILLRFMLSSLVPFIPKLAVVNELLRYPILSQSTITFVLWNFMLAPIIFLCLKDKAKRKAFVKYFTNFRLTQLHFFNWFLAIYSEVYGTPSRALTWTDLYASVVLGMQYGFFYTYYVLDRLGIHFYMVFSPRTNISILSWGMVVASTAGLFPAWSNVIQTFGGDWENKVISWNATENACNFVQLRDPQPFRRSKHREPLVFVSERLDLACNEATQRHKWLSRPGFWVRI